MEYRFLRICLRIFTSLFVICKKNRIWRYFYNLKLRWKTLGKDCLITFLLLFQFVYPVNYRINKKKGKKTNDHKIYLNLQVRLIISWSVRSYIKFYVCPKVITITPRKTLCSKGTATENRELQISIWCCYDLLPRWNTCLGWRKFSAISRFLQINFHCTSMEYSENVCLDINR